jgi:tape measure domain
MARDISIAISARDNFTQAITTMRNANQSFNKDLTGLQLKLNELNRTKSTLKVDTDKAKTALREAEKQFVKTGEAADKLKLELANANYENARRNLSLVSDNARQAEKDIKNLTNAVSKSENRASSKGASSGSSIVGSLAASGAAALVGNTLSGVATTLIGSAYGSEAGMMSSSAISTAGMGVAIGTAIAPGIGTAVGAALGGLVGLVQGQMQVFEKKDDAFKNYYEDLYNKSLDTQNQSLTNGSGIASTRETNKISFATLLKGDKNADKFLASMTDFAEKTPFEYGDLSNISKTLLAYGYKQNELLPLLQKVGDAGSALGMNNEDMKFVATSLGRMRTTNKTTLEYLNPLLERGIDVWRYLSDASGKTKKQVQEMVTKGLVPGAEAARAIADYMGKDFSGNMEKQSKTYSGLASTLEDNKNAMDNSMGEGYNQTRKTGMEKQIDWLGGESGEKMKSAYNKIGQWKASLTNLEEQYQRDALNSVMNGDVADSFKNSSQKNKLESLSNEYIEAQKTFNKSTSFGDKDGAQKAGAEMGRILAEAQAIATNEYNASEGAQLALQSNKTLADNIKNDTASQTAYWDAGYTMTKQFDKGLLSGMGEINPNSSKGIPTIIHDKMGKEISVEEHQEEIRKSSGRGYAYGLSYVPYDNYPALLHQGERVLTASESRSRKKASPVSVTGNTFIVREEGDIEQIAKEIAKMIDNAYELSEE